MIDKGYNTFTIKYKTFITSQQFSFFFLHFFSYLGFRIYDLEKKN